MVNEDRSSDEREFNQARLQPMMDRGRALEFINSIHNSRERLKLKNAEDCRSRVQVQERVHSTYKNELDQHGKANNEAMESLK
jgi:hypothetical protein